MGMLYLRISRRKAPAPSCADHSGHYLPEQTKSVLVISIFAICALCLLMNTQTTWLYNPQFASRRLSS